MVSRTGRRPPLRRQLSGRSARSLLQTAPRDIAPASHAAAQIVDAIGATAVMALIVPASNDDSPQVPREVERVLDKRVRVMAFRIENVLPA